MGECNLLHDKQLSQDFDIHYINYLSFLQKIHFDI